MIIESITIKNFRQFYGEVKLNFSTSSSHNVTVVHGANGSGKTSLLNAFKWCFYEETDFDTFNENILNKAAIQDQDEGGIIELRIEVKFLHDRKRFCVIRKQTYKRIGGLNAEALPDSEFVMDVTGDDGQTIRDNSPYLKVQSILPQDLQPYFFFNGERIEHIAGVNQSMSIRDAIRKLMGLELVDRSKTHVDRTKNSYRKLLRNEVSDEQNKYHDLIGRYEEDIRRNDEVFKSSKRKEEFAKIELTRIERELKRHEKSRELQEEREKLEGIITGNQEELMRIRKKQKEQISKKGFLVLSANLLQHCEQLVEENRKKGILPYGINKQFIDDRIDLGVCICGTTIIPGSIEHTCLTNAKQTAGTDELESAYTSVSGLLKTQKYLADEFYTEYKEMALHLNKIICKNEQVSNEIEEISAQLKRPDDNLISKLEIEHNNETKKCERARDDKAIALNNIDTYKHKLEESKSTLKRLEDKQALQNIANMRLKKAEHIGNILHKLSESISDKVRIDLSDRVNNTFQSIIRKSARAAIDDDYKLQVLKLSTTGEEYAEHEQSTGERQITSLSFISSIISLAREKHSNKNNSFFQGGLYPLVMDSPFGTLDAEYRMKIAASVSELAEQVIMFVSNSQWEGKVEEACRNKVGKSYKLVYHSPKPDIKESEYVVPSANGFEYSTLVEIT